MQEQTSVPTHEIGLDEIIAELDREYDGILPERALRAAQSRRDEITPRLIDLIRDATESARTGKVPDGAGHCYALLLLTEFRAKEALPAIVEAVSLPGEGPFDLFGDSITEDLSGVLAALAADTPEIIDRLIENRSLNEYVRLAAAQTYLYWVRDGRITRDDAVARLRGHLSNAIANKDADGASGIVAELVSYGPHESLHEIKEAFRRELVDESLVRLDTVERSIAGGDAWFEKELKRCPTTGVEDAVEELRGWAAYQEDRPAQSLAEVDQYEPAEPSVAADRTSRRVGRNEPCPCGSGKKYKKCCGVR